MVRSLLAASAVTGAILFAAPAAHADDIQVGSYTTVTTPSSGSEKDSYGTGSYGTGSYGTGSYGTGSYGTGSYQPNSYGTG
jgi:hypothetical protein